MSHSQEHSCCSSKSGCGCQSSQGSCCSGHKSCGCGSSGCGCGCQKKECGCKKEGCHAAEKFLALADCAWMEVLKEKIKENIKANDSHLDDLARLISETNHQRWQKKMQEKDCCGSFEEKLAEFFGQACHTKGQGQNQGNNPKGNPQSGNQKK
jgi:hypothetical protein